MVRVLSADLMVMDYIVRLHEKAQVTNSREQRLWDLIERHRMEPGGKIKISEADSLEFASNVFELPHTLHPGGSASNTMRTMGNILPRNTLEQTYMGVTGTGHLASIIQEQFAQANIKIVPEDIKSAHGEMPELGFSYILRLPGGERSIATYPGNANEFLKEEMVTPDLLKNVDALFLLGSTRDRNKLGRRIVDRLLEERWNNIESGKPTELWLSLPTSKAFAVLQRDYYEWLKASANVVLSNTDELQYMTEKDKNESLEDLRTSFAQERDVLFQKGFPPQVGFITDSKHGAFIVTPDDIQLIPAGKVEHIENTLGAGDTCFAGFLIGYTLGLKHEISAQIGIALATAKITSKDAGPTLSNPMANLTETAPELAKMVTEKIKEKSLTRSTGFAGLPQLRDASGAEISRQ